MSDGRDECAHCGKADYPPSLRRGSEHECRCGGSIYDGEERISDPEQELLDICADIQEGGSWAQHSKRFHELSQQLGNPNG